MEVLVAHVAAHLDGEGDGGQARPGSVLSVDRSAGPQGRGHRAPEHEHVRAIVDEAFQDGRIRRAPRPGEGAQGDRIHGQRRRGIAVACPRFELAEEPHQGGPIAGRGAPRVVEGGDGSGLRLQALDQGLRALLHGQEPRLRARLRPSGPACGLDVQVDGGGGLDEDEQGGQGGERTARAPCRGREQQGGGRGQDPGRGGGPEDVGHDERPRRERSRGGAGGRRRGRGEGARIRHQEEKTTNGARTLAGVTRHARSA